MATDQIKLHDHRENIEEIPLYLVYMASYSIMQQQAKSFFICFAIFIKLNRSMLSKRPWAEDQI